MRHGRVILAVLIAAVVIVGTIAAGLSLRRGSPSNDSGELQCGQWCVYRCAQLLGVPADMPEVVSRLPHGTGGHSMLEVARVLQSLGLETEGRQGDWDALVEGPRPGIAHLKDPQHFVVVCSVDPNREFVHLFDGEGYRTRYSRR